MTTISEAVLLTASGAHRLQLQVAESFLARFRGLMLAAPLRPNRGLLLTGCVSVHTFFMRQRIDLIYVDGSGVVTRCVAALKPWRSSAAAGWNLRVGARGSTRHVLELAAGSIARLQVLPGSRLVVPMLPALHPTHTALAAKKPRPEGRLPTRIRGSAMIEFTVVAPIITLIGLSTVQYGLMFFAKNQYNHAAFMAARAGSTGNADLAKIREAYTRALVPLYGGGTSTAKLATSYQRARADVQANVQIDMLNPTKESFDDFYDPQLQATLGGGVHRVIANGGLAHKKAAIVPSASGQNIHDANLLKLRITQGYQPQVPVVGALYARYLHWLDDGSSAVNSRLINAGRIPMVAHVVLHMQSDAIENGAEISIPGIGNGGNPVNPGTPPQSSKPPMACATTLCASGSGSSSAGTGGGGSVGGDTGGGDSSGGGSGGGEGEATPPDNPGLPPPGVCVAPATA